MMTMWLSKNFRVESLVIRALLLVLGLLAPVDHLLAQPGPTEEWKKITTLRPPGGVRSVAWSPDGRRIASGSFDGIIRVWNGQNYAPEPIATLRGHTAAVFSVTWSPDGKYLASGSQDNTIKIWDAVTYQGVAELTGHTSPVAAVAWSPDSRRIASASWDQRVGVWQVAPFGLIRFLLPRNRPVWSVAWSPDSRRIAAGAYQNIHIWDAGSYDRIGTLGGHEDSVFSLMWSFDGRRLISGSWDQKVKVWDTDTYRHIITLAEHRGPVWSVTWSSEDRWFASASADNTIRVWNGDTYALVTTLTGHTGRVFSTTWLSMPKSCRMASGAEDAQIIVRGCQLRGIDISSALSPSQWNRMVERHHPTFVIADAWGGRSRFPAQEILSGAPAGLRKAAYCLLNYDNRVCRGYERGPSSCVAHEPLIPQPELGGAWQVRQAIAAVGTEIRNIDFMAIDVEGENPPADARTRIQRIREAVQAVQQARLKPIIYTAERLWMQITGDSHDFADLPLWHAIPDDHVMEDQILDLDRRNRVWQPSFGGWTRRAGKQYEWREGEADTFTQPAIPEVDLNVFDPFLFRRSPP